jgi:hypothetical protein
MVFFSAKFDDQFAERERRDRAGQNETSFGHRLQDHPKNDNLKIIDYQIIPKMTM